MRKILNLSTLSLLFFAAVFMTSCEEEPGTGGGGGTGGVNEDPTVSLISASDLTVAPNEQFTVDFSAAPFSGNSLQTIEVFEDGVSLPMSRLLFNGEAAPANPVLLTGTDVEGISWTTTITAHSSAATTVVYEIEARDTDGNGTSIFINVTTAATPPTLTGAEPTTIEGLEQGSTNAFRLSATPGDGLLVSLEVRENDQLVEPSRIEFDGAAMMNNDNPFLLGEAEQSGFEDVRLFIVLPNMEGTFIYTIILVDEFGLSAETQYTVTTAPSGTAVDMREDVVLNQSGAAPGGLDLDTGENVSSSSDMAEIIDNGIDTDMTPDANWIQTISPVNGTQMKYVVAGTGGIPEGFSFDGLEFKEDIEGLFTANSNQTIDETVSTSVVIPGDVFIVNNGDNYWLLRVKEVMVTPNDNNDQYVFDVKF